MNLLLPAMHYHWPRRTKARGSDIFAPRSLETLLPVDLKEAWSDQIKDVEVNGMPDKTGGSSKPYIFMGARDGGKRHGKLKLRSAIEADMQAKILWRFAKTGTQKPDQAHTKNREKLCE